MPAGRQRGPREPWEDISERMNREKDALESAHQHDTSSDRTPFARMFPSVIGSIGSVERDLAIGV